MPKICYQAIDLSKTSLAVVAQANRIIAEYTAAGYTLTLRQLYYRFVASDLLPNTVQSYKRLGSIINDGRLAGLIDWEAIEDRTRNLRGLSHWSSPSDIIHSAARSYHRDLWRGQATCVEVWVEKDALVDVVGRAAEAWDVSYFACRGYVSQSEMWSAARRLIRYGPTVILHLGDHDPSGIDMTRDITDRLTLFGADVEVRRIALNFDQVEEYQPPPNPAKATDARYEGYARRFGEESWELDALEPRVLDALIQRHIREIVDEKRFTAEREQQERERKDLTAVARQWEDVVATVREEEEE